MPRNQTPVTVLQRHEVFNSENSLRQLLDSEKPQTTKAVREHRKIVTSQMNETGLSD